MIPTCQYNYAGGVAEDRMTGHSPGTAVRRHLHPVDGTRGPSRIPGTANQICRRMQPPLVAGTQDPHRLMLTLFLMKTSGQSPPRAATQRHPRNSQTSGHGPSRQIRPLAPRISPQMTSGPFQHLPDPRKLAKQLTALSHPRLQQQMQARV